MTHTHKKLHNLSTLDQDCSSSSEIHIIITKSSSKLLNLILSFSIIAIIFAPCKSLTTATNPNLFNYVGDMDFNNYNVSDIYTIRDDYLIVGNWNDKTIRFYDFDISTPPYLTLSVEFVNAAGSPWWPRAVGGIRNTNYAYALTRKEAIQFYDISVTPPTGMAFMEESARTVDTDGREAAPIYHPGSTLMAVGTKWSIWMYDYSVYPAPHARSAVVMFKLTHLETAGLVYIEGTMLIAHAGLSIPRNYGSAPNYNNPNYFKRISLYQYDNLELKRELFFQEPFEDSTAQIRCMNNIPYTNHIVVGTEVERKLFFFDVKSPTDIPYNIIDLGIHSTTTSEIFHLRGFSKSDYVSVGFEDGTIEVFRSSRPERVWEAQPDSRTIFRVTHEKDNDLYMLAASGGWLNDHVSQPATTPIASKVYIYKREPLRCDLKSHTLGYETSDTSGELVCKLCFRESFLKGNEYLCS